jgi:serine-type D-Ala-D-Ala carboxypeptidase (penicillin-binding protein 5/6)
MHRCLTKNFQERKQVAPPMTRRVFAVLLGAPTADDRIAGAGSLLNYAFSAYKDYPIYDRIRPHSVTRLSAANLAKANGT